MKLGPPRVASLTQPLQWTHKYSGPATTASGLGRLLYHTRRQNAEELRAIRKRHEGLEPLPTQLVGTGSVVAPRFASAPEDQYGASRRGDKPS